MEQVFTDVYENKVWGDNQLPEYNGSSGGGSAVEYNDHYIPFLKKVLAEKDIRTVVDLGCGDFRCGKLIYDDMDVTYTGYDAYQKVVEYNSTQFPSPKYTFQHLDFYTYKEHIKHGDLCILKDVLQHWPLQNIYTFLDYIIHHQKFKYILICNCGYQTTHNTNIPIGAFRPLSCKYLPLSKYNPIKLYTYHTKEISMIQVKKSMENELIEIKKELYELKKMISTWSNFA